ncbi:MAG: twin-arginine translocation signal domain-containing protein [Hyphomicrobiaceae bacterium]|nr:twin-arginine translocation signal domain-containing protein [Hyphomicrobiaceae bacterium]
MDRRDFIKSTGVAAAAIAAGTTSAVAQAPASPAAPAIHAAPAARELRVASAWPQTGRGFDDSAHRLAQAIATLSGGRYRLTFSPSPDGLSALTSGKADLYHGSGHDFLALDRAFAFFAGLPGNAAVRPTYLHAWLMAGGGQSLWDDLSAPHGFKPFFAGHSGARAKLWSRAPVANLADLQGRRIAATGLGVDVVRDLGAEAVTLPPADLAGALADGRVDAVEWGGTIAAFGCDLHRHARHCLRPGLSRSGFTAVLAVRSALWSSISAVDQAIFAAAASQELNTVVAESLVISARLRTSMTERDGVAFAGMPPDVTAAAGKAAERAIAAIASASPAAARIHASYTAFRSGLPAVRRRRTNTPIA